MQTSRRIVYFALILLCFSLAAQARDWRTVKTDNFIVYYLPGYEQQARQVLAIMEEYRPQVEALTGNKVRYFPVVLEDVGMVSNGFTNPVLPSIHLYRASPRSPTGVENWWAYVGVHEYTHALHLTKAGGLASAMRSFFGEYLQPNMLTPLWLAEGTTVYSESRLSPYAGRLNDGYFDAYIGASVKGKRFPSAAEISSYPWTKYPVDSAYLFGGEFFRYLAETYGEKTLTEFYAANGDMPLSSFSMVLPGIGMDRAARRVYHKPFQALWREWQQHEQAQHRDFFIDGAQLTHRGWAVQSPVISGGKLYYQCSSLEKTGVYHGFALTRIIERDLTSGQERTVVEQTSQFNLPLKVHGDTLYYSVLETRPGYANVSNLTYGYESAVHAVDLTTGADRQILHGQISAFEQLPDGVILYATCEPSTFGSVFWRFDPHSGQQRQLGTVEYLIHHIVADDARVIVSARKDWETVSLYALSLDTLMLTPLVHTPFQEACPSLSGDQLYFAANYGGRFAIYAYDFTTGQLSQLTQGGYAFDPAVDSASHTLYFVGINPDGHDLYAVAMAQQPFTLPDAPPSTRPALLLDEKSIRQGTYLDNLISMAPKFMMPAFKRDDTQTTFGLDMQGGSMWGDSDALGEFPSYRASLAYDFKNKRPRAGFTLVTSHFAPLTADLAYTDDDAKEWTVNLQYPMRRRLQPGLGTVTAGLSFATDDDMARKELTPALLCSWNAPRTESLLLLRMPIEQKSLGSDLDRFGVWTDLRISRYLSQQSELALRVQHRYDPDDPDAELPSIRGYAEELRVGNGACVALDYTRPLFHLNQYTWNPMLGLHDICGTLFVDGAWPQEMRKRYSYGAELHLESMLLAGNLPVDTGARLVKTRDSACTLEWFIGIAGNF